MTFSTPDIPLTPLGPLLSRRVLPHAEGLMMVEVHFRKGGVGEPHSHDAHEQMSYILKGSFEVRIGDEVKVLKAGEGFVARRNVVHGVVALEDSVILDVFNPIRQDFLGA